MSGGGSGGYFPSRPSELHKLIDKARATAEQQQLESEVNKLLQDLLTTFNQRDAEKIQEYLKAVEEVLSGSVEMEQFLFGGSVARHTYVDGLSDIDALVILNRKELSGQSPQQVLGHFCGRLKNKLTSDSVNSVEKGTLAVTVNYGDGTQLQLLPAVRLGTRVEIPTRDGKGWKETNPKAFQRALTRANKRLDLSLVPTIKLVKSIVSGFPEQKRLSGYHLEALAIDAVKGYRGQKTPKALLVHVLEHASKRVLSPIQDVSGQSRIVDSYLGVKNSVERQVAADALASVSRQLRAAKTIDQWKVILVG
ncbi:MAG: CBASS oligonucleotide cyclase [Desulfomonilaceae bacterium]